MSVRYHRIMLKLSGEALAGAKGYGIDSSVIDQIAGEVRDAQAMGVQICVVLGGGNIFRGVAGSTRGVDRTVGDSVGMLATLMNGLLFGQALSRAGAAGTVLSAIDIPDAAEYYTPRRAVTLLEQGEVVIIAAGTGNPYFTTDTAAALRCAETRCDILMKATKVDGVYDSDPATNPAAHKIPRLTHAQALEQQLRVMDITAFSFCMENNIPIAVFKLMEPGNLRACLEGRPVGSVVSREA